MEYNKKSKNIERHECVDVYVCVSELNFRLLSKSQTKSSSAKKKNKKK